MNIGAFGDENRRFAGNSSCLTRCCARRHRGPRAAIRLVTGRPSARRYIFALDQDHPHTVRAVMNPPRKQAPQPSRPRPQPVAGPSRLGPGPGTVRKQGATAPVYNRPPIAPVVTSPTHKSFYKSRDGAPAVPNFMNWDLDGSPARRSGVKMMRTRLNNGAARKSAQVQRERPPDGRYYLKNGRLARVSDSSDDDHDEDHNDGLGHDYDDLEDM